MKKILKLFVCMLIFIVTMIAINTAFRIIFWVFTGQWIMSETATVFVGVIGFFTALFIVVGYWDEILP